MENIGLFISFLIILILVIGVCIALLRKIKPVPGGIKIGWKPVEEDYRPHDPVSHGLSLGDIGHDE